MNEQRHESDEEFESFEEQTQSDIETVTASEKNDSDYADTITASENDNTHDSSTGGQDETTVDNPNVDPDFNSRTNTDNGERVSTRKRTAFVPFQLGNFAFLVEPSNDYEPKSVAEAKECENHEKWSKAMDEEMDSHRSNSTWILTYLPKDRKAITAKWVFKLKGIATENERFKARLLARGYAQVAGIDYYETFSPVIRQTSLRILFAMATTNNMQIFQMDAVTAFLQSELKEQIYMKQPEGYTDGTDRVCLLKKSIYGLKQAGREWNSTLDRILRKSGLMRSKFDPCVYLNEKKSLWIAVYVDDFLFFYKEKNELNEIKQFLNSSLKMKEIGEARECIGIQISITNDGIELSQEKYIKRFDMLNCKAAKTPGNPKEKLTEKTINSSNELTGKVPYQELVGSLLYAAQITRPDISYCVNNVSRFN